MAKDGIKVVSSVSVTGTLDVDSKGNIFFNVDGEVVPINRVFKSLFGQQVSLSVKTILNEEDILYGNEDDLSEESFN